MLDYHWRRASENTIKVHQRLKYIISNNKILNKRFMAIYICIYILSEKKKLFFFGIIPSNQNVLSEYSFCNKLFLHPTLLQKAVFYLKRVIIPLFYAMSWSNSTFTGSTETPLTSLYCKSIKKIYTRPCKIKLCTNIMVVWWLLFWFSQCRVT